MLDPADYGVPSHTVKEKSTEVVFQRFTDGGAPEVRRDAPIIEGAGLVRLSKLVGELGLLSRREADNVLKMGDRSKTRIFLNGVDVTGRGVGYKVERGTAGDVKVGRLKRGGGGDMEGVLNPGALTLDEGYGDWESRRRETIVINKPLGYVTGAMEPAPRRSTWTVKTDVDSRGREYHAYKPLFSLISGESYYHGKTHEERPSEGMVKRMLAASNGKGMAPAGRLDINSSGLVIFTRDGVMARKLVGEGSEIEKEVRNEGWGGGDLRGGGGDLRDERLQIHKTS